MSQTFDNHWWQNIPFWVKLIRVLHDDTIIDLNSIMFPALDAIFRPLDNFYLRDFDHSYVICIHVSIWWEKNGFTNHNNYSINYYVINNQRQLHSKIIHFQRAFRKCVIKCNRSRCYILLSAMIIMQQYYLFRCFSIGGRDVFSWLNHLFRLIEVCVRSSNIE